MMKTYSQMRVYDTFGDRFEYLMIRGVPGQDTFGESRWLNQKFYASREWRLVRNRVIARDLGLDLGVEGHEILDRVYIHHINPITPEMLYKFDPWVLDTENLISVSHDTHNALHYGAKPPDRPTFVVREPGDTTLW